jgi:hypothetical protein
VAHQQLKLKPYGILESIDFVISVTRDDYINCLKRMSILDCLLFWKNG